MNAALREVCAGASLRSVAPKRGLERRGEEVPKWVRPSPKGGEGRGGGWTGWGYFTGVGTQAPQSTTPPQPSGMKPQASEGHVAGTHGIIGGSEPTQAPRSNSM